MVSVILCISRFKNSQNTDAFTLPECVMNFTLPFEVIAEIILRENPAPGVFTTGVSPLIPMSYRYDNPNVLPLHLQNKFPPSLAL
jgi:hypothetical protein